MAETFSVGAQPDGPAPGQALPPLGDLAYRAQRFLLTDSKMSEILVVRDEAGRDLVFKIACVRQRSRAQANRQAIYNSVTWLETVGRHPGLIALHPIQRRGKAALPATPPTYVAALTECPGSPEFIVLDYMQGSTVSDFVRKRPLPFKVALWLAHQLAATLDHLHGRGCVHRDLKPENVLFATPPRQAQTLQALQPMLIDFGVAAGKGEAKFVCGSRLWMAPELQEAYEQKLLPVDPSWDMYALGLICCYMLSGLRPRRRAYAHQDYLDYQREAFACCDEALAEKNISAPPALNTFKALLSDTLAKASTERPTAATFAKETATLLAALGSAVEGPKAVVKQPSQPVTTVTSVSTQFNVINNASATIKPTGIKPPTTVMQPVSDVQQLPATRLSSWRNLFSRRAVIGGVLILTLLVLVPTVIGGMAESSPATALTDKAEPSLLASSVGVTAAEQAAIEPVVARVTLSPTARYPVAQNEHEAASTQVDQANVPPTLIPILTVAKTVAITVEPIPTLAVLPVPSEPANAVPTLAILAATPTLAPTLSPIPTHTATSRPTNTPTNTPRAPAALKIRLLAPAPEDASSEPRVTFVWESIGAVPTTAQCYELVFWDPKNSADKRSPVGAGRESRRTVNLRALADGTEPLLRTLARSTDGFAWGVRIVDCATPRTILQDVGDEQRYRYQP